MVAKTVGCSTIWAPRSSTSLATHVHTADAGRDDCAGQLSKEPFQLALLERQFTGRGDDGAMGTHIARRPAAKQRRSKRQAKKATDFT